MPNGGESGRQLDRLQDQVDATRTELGEVAEALNGLRELVTELVRRSGSEHREDRWQAKLGSLETRLGMMETTIRSEVERMRAAAGAVDALADEFKSTVGDTHSLVSLAADIGNRLDVLQALENEVRGAAQEITSSVSDRLERDANDREQRERALADRIAETIAESRGAVADLADRLEHAAQTQSSVAEAISGIGGDLSGLRADLDASGETNRRTTSDALGVLSTELQAFERRLVEGNAQDTRLRELLDLVAQVRAEQPQLAGRVDGVATEVAALQRTLSEPLASVDTIIERVDSLAAAVRDAVAGQPDPRPQLDQLAERLGAVHARLPDAAELGDRLAAEIAELRTSQPDYGEALQRLSAVVSALPTEQVDPTDALERVAAEVAELRNNQPNTDDVVARVRAELATLRDTLPDATVPAERAIELLADQSAVLADMRSTQPTFDLDPLTQRIDALAGQLTGQLEQLRAGQPQLDVDLEPIARQIAALAERLDAQLVELRSRPDPTFDVEPINQHIATTADRLESQLAELRSRPEPTFDVEPLAQRIDSLSTQLSGELEQLRAGQPQLDVDFEPIAQQIATLAERLDAQLGELRSRPDPTIDLEPLLARIDDTSAQLAQMRAAQPATDAVVGRIASTLGEQSETLTQLRSGQPQLTVRLDQLATDLAELAQRQQALAMSPERFDQLSADLVQRVQAAQPELELRLERVQAELADVRSRLPDPEAALAPVTERLERVAEDVARLHSTEPALTRLADELTQLRAAQIDPSAVQSFFAERLDRVLAEMAALRAAQPDPNVAGDVAASVRTRLEQLDLTLSSLRDEIRSTPAPVVDVEDALAPLEERLTTIDQQAGATADSVARFEGQLTRTGMQLEELAGAVAALRDTPDDIESLAPIVDRLAMVSDSVSSVHRDVAGLAESLSSVRSDRSQLTQIAGDTNARLDVLTATVMELREARPDLSATTEHLQQLAGAVADLRDSRPDLTSSFAALTDLVESLQSGVTETRNRIDALHEGLRTSDVDVQSEMATVIEPVLDRLDSLAARAAITEEQVGTTLDDLAVSVVRFDSEQAAAVRTHIDELRQAVHALGDRQASALMDVVQRFEQVSANAAATQDAIRAIDTALTAPKEDPEAGERLGDLAQQVASLASDVRASVRSIVGLGADLTALRTDVETLTVAVPDAGETEAAMRAAVVTLDTTMADRDRQLRELVDRLDHAVADRDADLEQALTRLYNAINTTAQSQDVSSVTSRVEEGLADLRRELQGVRQASESSDVLEMMRALADRDPAAAVQPVNVALRDVRADLQSTRAELQSMSQTVNELRSELRRTDEMGGGAGAALVASAATAMARLEARMDGEFDSVGRQMEALGTLLGQVIDSVHRVEAQVIGVHPMSERVRSSAASVLDALRTNVRQRQSHRQGPPPEIGSGRSY